MQFLKKPLRDRAKSAQRSNHPPTQAGLEQLRRSGQARCDRLGLKRKGDRYLISQVRIKRLRLQAFSPMSIILTPEQEELIQIQLQTGRFNSAEEVIQAALQLLVASPASLPKRLHVTPAAQGSGYTDTAINHDRVLANLNSETPA
ncbi:MAG TPA: type II toxin-antitoxin system ParD family antitoxin [Coleofasciculaceae cyanobacterium]